MVSQLMALQRLVPHMGGPHLIDPTQKSGHTLFRGCLDSSASDWLKEGPQEQRTKQQVDSKPTLLYLSGLVSKSKYTFECH